jgi:hypothetical protein
MTCGYGRTLIPLTAQNYHNVISQRRAVSLLLLGQPRESFFCFVLRYLRRANITT